VLFRVDLEGLERERERERERLEKSSSFLVGSVEIACRGLDWRETRI